MDIPYADADRVAKAIPPALDMTLEKALAESPALKEMEQKDERIKELLAVARRLEGMTRHASVHAAGVVIAPRPLTEFVPLYKSQKDEIVTQWAMKEVERVGLLKMDFLGLSTLTLIRDALDEIKRTEGIDLDIDAIPLDDAKTYKLFADGQTYGVFQFESSGMRELLRKAKPERLDDLIALNALYRPGPLKSGMVDDYIARKQGKTEVKYDLPQLAPILGTPTASSPTRNRSCASPRCWPGSRWASPTCCARPWARRTPRSWPSSAKPSWRGPRRTTSTRRRPRRSST